MPLIGSTTVGSPLADILKVAVAILLVVALGALAWNIAFGGGGVASVVSIDTGSDSDGATERLADALTNEDACNNVLQDHVWRDGRCVRLIPPPVVTPPTSSTTPQELPDTRQEPDPPVEVWLSHELRCTDCDASISTEDNVRKVYYRQTMERTLKADQATLPTHRAVRPGGTVRIPVTIDTTNLDATTQVTIEPVFALDRIPGRGGKTYCEQGARSIQHGFADAGGHLELGAAYSFKQAGARVGSSVTLIWEPGDEATKWAALEVDEDVDDGGVVCLKLTPADGAHTSASNPISTMFSVKVCGWRFVPEDDELAFKSIFDPDPATGTCPDDELPEEDLDTRQPITRRL